MYGFAIQDDNNNNKATAKDRCKDIFSIGADQLKQQSQKYGIFKIQIDTMRPAADDLEKVEADLCNKELLKNSKDIQETDRLLAEFDALEWLQWQIAV